MWEYWCYHNEFSLAENVAGCCNVIPAQIVYVKMHYCNSHQVFCAVNNTPEPASITNIYNYAIQLLHITNCSLRNTTCASNSHIPFSFLFSLLLKFSAPLLIFIKSRFLPLNLSLLSYSSLPNIPTVSKYLLYSSLSPTHNPSIELTWNRMLQCFCIKTEPCKFA